MSTSSLPENPGMNGGNFNNPGNYNNFQPNNPYGGGPSPGYDYNPPNNAGANGTQFQGGRFQQRAWNSVEEKTLSLQPQTPLEPKTSRRQKLFFTLLLLSTALTLCYSYTWFLTKLHSIPHSSTANLPIIGFVGIVASFAMCSSVKHFTVKRLRVRSAQCVSCSNI